jgi:hypothetical protein
MRLKVIILVTSVLILFSFSWGEKEVHFYLPKDFHGQIDVIIQRELGPNINIESSVVEFKVPENGIIPVKNDFLIHFRNYKFFQTGDDTVEITVQSTPFHYDSVFPQVVLCGNGSVGGFEDRVNYIKYEYYNFFIAYAKSDLERIFDPEREQMIEKILTK